ncbi:FAD-dependent monooxygenase [Streptomyces sp. NPDC002055]|uniref:FAD-dependent monooxygenase n=1 Tax=Streptomyces sp. NPDC002055 TaxID=3154534 RepID=UPI003316A512
MPENRPTKVLIIGAGIGGLTLAVALRRLGMEAVVHERATELRAAGSGLSVTSNAMAALDTLGIDLHLAKWGHAVTSFAVRTTRGRLIRRLPLPEIGAELGVPTVCISRTDLQQALLEAAGDTPIVLGSAATRVEPDGTVHFEDGTTARGDVVVGADGFHSVVRRGIVGPEEDLDGGYVCWLGIAPFSHPRLSAGGVIHYWGSGQRFGLVDIGHGRVYWWGTKNMPPSRSLNWQGDKDEILSAYSGWAEETQAAVRATPREDILAVGSRYRTFQDRWGEGPVTLLGDAAHPMPTSLGQGAAMAMEDAVVLARTLAGATDLPAALRTYEDRRRERTRAVVNASIATSTMEQLENPLRRLARDSYLRLVPNRTLLHQQRAALTFPGIPD